MATLSTWIHDHESRYPYLSLVYLLHHLRLSLAILYDHRVYRPYISADILSPDNLFLADNSARPTSKPSASPALHHPQLSTLTTPSHSPTANKQEAEEEANAMLTTVACLVCSIYLVQRLFSDRPRNRTHAHPTSHTRSQSRPTPHSYRHEDRVYRSRSYSRGARARW